MQHKKHSSAMTFSITVCKAKQHGAEQHSAKQYVNCDCKTVDKPQHTIVLNVILPKVIVPRGIFTFKLP
jgi:hypothetical protein